MNNIVLYSIIVTVIAIVLGYVSVVHESTLFSAILITFICVGVTTLMIAMALQNPQKQVELEKSVSKEKLRKNALTCIQLFSSTADVSPLQTIKTVIEALKSMEGLIIDVCIENNILEKLLVELSHANLSNIQEGLLEHWLELLYSLLKSKMLQARYISYEYESAHHIVQQIVDISKRILEHQRVKNNKSIHQSQYLNFNTEKLWIIMIFKVLLVNHSLPHDILGNEENRGVVLILTEYILPLNESAALQFSLLIQKTIKHASVCILILMSQNELCHKDFIDHHGLEGLLICFLKYMHFIDIHHHKQVAQGIISSHDSPHFREIVMTVLSIWHRYALDHPHDQLDWMKCVIHSANEIPEHMNMVEVLLQLKQRFRQDATIHTLTTKLLEYIGTVISY